MLESILAEGRPDGTAPARICGACAGLLPVSGAAISVRGDVNVPATVSSSDPVALRLEDAQLSTGEGPCVDAVTVGQPVLVADLNAAAEMQRWPLFAADALAAGAQAVFAFPLVVGSVHLGVLDLYRDEPGALSAADVANSVLVATAASEALVQQWQANPSEQLDDPWWGGATFDGAHVHQATGRVMVQLSVDPVEALLRLRAVAFVRGQPLSEVARDVAEGVLRLDAEAPPDPTDEGA